MKQMLLGIYLAVLAVFVLLLTVYEVLPVYAAWASILLALLSVLCFLNGYTGKDNSAEDKTTENKK